PSSRRAPPRADAHGVPLLPRTRAAAAASQGVQRMFRPSRRALALRAPAVVAGLATAWVVTADLARLHRRAGDLGPEQPAVVARRDLSIGSVVTAHDVATRRAHRSLLPAGTLTSAREALGRTVAVP